MVRSNIARSALLAITTAFVLGCGGTTGSPSPAATASATPTPAASTAPSPSASASAAATPAASQATTGRIEVPDKGFAITLPDGWQSFPVDPVALQKLADTMGTGSGVGAAFQRAIDTGQIAALTFWAFDMREGTQGTRNVTLLSQPASNIPLSLVESAVKGQIAAIDGVGEISSETVTLPAGEALRLTYSVTATNAAGKPIETTQVLYWIETDKHTFVVTGTGPDAGNDADFKAIAASLEAI